MHDADHAAAPLEELAVLYESLEALTSTLDLGEVLHTLLARCRAVTAAQALSLLLYDPQRDELVFAATEMLGDHALVDRGAAAGTDAEIDPTESPRRIVLPLSCPDRPGALLVLEDPVGEAAFAAEAHRRLGALADELGARLCRGVEHDAEALAQLFARATSAVDCRRATLVLHDAQGRRMVFRSSRALAAGVIDGVRIPLDHGIAGWVARHRRALRLEDAASDPRHDPTLARQTGLVPRGMICVPLVHRDRLLGVLQVIDRIDGRPFTDADERLVHALAGHAAVAVANAQLYHEVEQASLTDDLTGLGNTRRFHRMLPVLLERAQPLSLLVLDLDRLKPVVDGFGHLVGSRTIATVGRLIAEQLRPGDVAARFGGDEFVVLLPRTDVPAARDAAERIRAAVQACAAPDGLTVDIARVTASVGVATAPRHAVDADGLFRAADAAMYVVKRGGRNGVAVAGASDRTESTPEARWTTPSDEGGREGGSERPEPGRRGEPQ